MKRSYIKYFIALLIFGSNGVVSSNINLTSYEIVLLRALFGSILLFVIFWLGGGRPADFRPKKDVISVVLSGVFMAADWLFLFEAYVQIGVSMSVVINYCGPIIVVALSPILFREKITVKRMLSLIAAMSGAILISEQVVLGSMNMWGLLCAALSALSYSGMIIFNKRSEDITGLANSMLQLLAALVTIAIFVGIKHGYYIHIEAGDWLPVLWLGLVNTGISCWLFFSSIGKLPVQTVAICGYIEPLAGVLLAVIVLGERMSLIQIFGAFLIIGGAVYGECCRLSPEKNLGRISPDGKS